MVEFASSAETIDNEGNTVLLTAYKMQDKDELNAYDSDLSMLGWDDCTYDYMIVAYA
jgi:hypothetical protein